MVEEATTIGSLPSEVLAHIFKCGTTLPSTTTLSSTRPSCLPALVASSAVSQQWRAAALNYPDLWTQICVPFSMRNPVAWIGLCLERSKSCLFDMTMELPAGDTSAVVAGVMRLVLQHVQRLRLLAISAESFLAHPAELFALLQNAQRAPRLAVLELTFADPNPTATMRIPTGGLLLQAPALSSLMLHGVLSPVPFVGLRSLDIEGLQTTYADFRDMAVASPLLTNLILPKLRLMVDLQSKSLPPIEMLSLKRLALSFSKAPPSNQFTPCHNLISLLQIPNLEYLELAGAFVPDMAKCFPEPSVFTKLRTLRLVGSPIFTRASPTEPAVDNCVYLRSLSAVEELELINCYAEYLLPTGSRTEARMENGAGPHALPRRRSINMRDVGPTGLYRRFEQFRMHAAAPLAAHGHPSPPDSNSVTIYPNLRSVSLDTLLAGEAVWLYQLVSQRPEIKVVHLSQLAERHFATSLAMVDGVLQTLPNRKHIGASNPDPVDVGKLLRERVMVRLLETEGYVM